MCTLYASSAELFLDICVMAGEFVTKEIVGGSFPREKKQGSSRASAELWGRCKIRTIIRLVLPRSINVKFGERTGAYV